MSMGKGSGRRPPAISDNELADRWAATFGVPEFRMVCSYCGGTGCEHQAATERWARGEEPYPGG
jgi:hypothetical protein